MAPLVACAAAVPETEEEDTLVVLWLDDTVVVVKREFALAVPVAETEPEEEPLTLEMPDGVTLPVLLV